MMRFFDFLLTPSRRCEKDICKHFLDDVVKVLESTIGKDLNADKDEDRLLIATIVLSVTTSVVETLKKDRPFQKEYKLSDSEYDKIVLKVSNKINKKYIPNWDNMMTDTIRRNIMKKSHYKLLYFYGGSCDDMATELFGKSFANELVSRQNERFRIDPPSIPVEMVNIGEREDLVERYKVQVFPSFFLVDKNGDVLKEWRGELTGTTVNNYIKENL